MVLTFFSLLARRVDNAIEIAVMQGQTLSRMMFQRKKMYLQRDKFADYFPPLHLINHTSDNDDDDDDSEDDTTPLKDDDPWETTMTDDDVIRPDDIPLGKPKKREIGSQTHLFFFFFFSLSFLDMVMNMMDTLPKLSPTHRFNF
jgi:hypothetical protein